MRPMSFQVLWSSYNFGLLPIEWVIWGLDPVSGALCVYCDTVSRSSVTPYRLRRGMRIDQPEGISALSRHQHQVRIGIGVSVHACEGLWCLGRKCVESTLRGDD